MHPPEAGAATGTVAGADQPIASTTGPARAARRGPFDRRLLRELRVVRITLAASVAVGLVSTAAVVAQALVLARLLASAMPGAPSGDRVADFVWLGAAVAVRGLAALAGEMMAHVGAAAAKAELRHKLLAALVSSAPRHGTAPGGVAAIAGRGLDALDIYLGRCLPDLVLAATAPVVLLVAVGALDWLSALILVVAIALFPLFGALVGRASMGLATERWRQVENLGRQVADIFEGLPVLRAFGRAARQRERIAEANEALSAASLKTLRVAFLSALVLDTLASVSVALVAVPLGLRLLDGSIALSAALAVLIVAPEVLLPLRRASAEFHESTEGLAAAAHAFSAIGPPVAGDGAHERAAPGTADPRQRRGVPDPARVPVALRGAGVELSGHATPLLADATLVISPGETVALVGGNGTGKSTVASLLLGFSPPSRGSVAVGGTDLRELDLRQWREKLAYLPEHPTLLATTLAENLRLANEQASDDELLDALARAGGGTLAAALPEGLATRLGDGGRPTAAGERQRIALARILLRPASLYVLDEPTVHLDPQLEAQVVAELGRLLAEPSALVITHRPAVLGLADRVVTLTAGRFVPVSRPSDLQRPGGRHQAGAPATVRSRTGEPIAAPARG